MGENMTVNLQKPSILQGQIRSHGFEIARFNVLSSIKIRVSNLRVIIFQRDRTATFTRGEHVSPGVALSVIKGGTHREVLITWLRNGAA